MPHPALRPRSLVFAIALLSAPLGHGHAAPGGAPETGSASARLDTLGRAWWGDHEAEDQDAPKPVPGREVSLLDAERADPATWLALRIILGLEPADRWRVSGGQTYVQQSPDDTEAALLAKLGPLVGLRRPKAFEVRTEANTVVWLGLSSPQGSVDVPVAYPVEWRTVEAMRDMRAAGWPVPEVDPVGLIDASFEDPIALRVAWAQDGVVVQDRARTTLGAHSVRLEGDTKLVQRVPVTPGVAIGARVKLTAEGGSAIRLVLRWEDDSGAKIAEVESATVSDGTWTDVDVDAVAPASASAVAVVLTATGDGFANADDLRFTRSDAAPGAPRRLVRAWQGTAVRLLADPSVVPDAEAHLARIDQAVRGALGLLGQPTASVVDVRFGPTRVPLPICSATTDADAAACVLATDLAGLWGPPGNALFASAFTTALSGADLPPARGDLRAGLAWKGGEPPDAWVSFSRWLLDAYGTAAVRAAWQSRDLASFEAGGKDLDGLANAWEK